METPTDKSSAFFLDGYCLAPLKWGQTIERVRERLAEVARDELDPGFCWESRYPRTVDLRPSAVGYEQALLDLIVESEIPQLTVDLGLDLVLSHVQLRRSHPGPSYMPWHRDTHAYGGKRVGQFPPVYKLIYYPRLGRPPQKRLQMIRGSHRRFFTHRMLDKAQARLGPKQDFYSSDDDCVFFNTAILHHTVPEVDEGGSLRVIYSFCSPTQLAAYKGNRELHEWYESETAKAVRPGGGSE